MLETWDSHICFECLEFSNFQIYSVWSRVFFSFSAATFQICFCLVKVNSGGSDNCSSRRVAELTGIPLDCHGFFWDIS